MHDIDRTQLETTEEFEPEFEAESEGEFDGEGEWESPFNEAEEMEFASELMEITDEAELDQFLGKLIRRAGRSMKRVVQTPIGRAVGGYLKGAIKKAIPGLSIYSTLAAPGLAAFAGSTAAAAGDAVAEPDQMPSEPVADQSSEDQEFETAKDLVRMAGSAVSNALQQPQASDLRAAAKSAVEAAAQRHAPELLGAPSRAKHGARRMRSGRWYRRDGRIVLMGA